MLGDSLPGFSLVAEIGGLARNSGDNAGSVNVCFSLVAEIGGLASLKGSQPTRRKASFSLVAEIGGLASYPFALR